MAAGAAKTAPRLTVAAFQLGERLEYWDGERWVLARRSFGPNVRIAVPGGWARELTEVDEEAAARTPQGE